MTRKTPSKDYFPVSNRLFWWGMSWKWGFKKKYPELGIPNRFRIIIGYLWSLASQGGRMSAVWEVAEAIPILAWIRLGVPLSFNPRRKLHYGMIRLVGAGLDWYVLLERFLNWYVFRLHRQERSEYAKEYYKSEFSQKFECENEIRSTLGCETILQVGCHLYQKIPRTRSHLVACPPPPVFVVITFIRDMLSGPSVWARPGHLFLNQLY